MAALRGEKQRLTPEEVARRLALDMAEWVRDNTPSTDGWLRADARPEYGIVAPWPLGHIIETVARRPTAVTNFGDDIGRENFELVSRVYRSREAEANELLERLESRYVIAQRGHTFLGGPQPGRGSMFHSLWFLDGSRERIGPNDRSRSETPALERHRLVYESRPIDLAAESAQPFYKVFEFVSAAKVVGRGRPGARVDVELSLRTNWGREIRYASDTIVGPDGMYRLRLPYASRGGPPAVAAAGPYEIGCDGERAMLQVDEAAVQGGLELAGPDLCAGPENGAG
jgi:hypothetical protein